MSEAKDRYEELLIMCPEFSKFEITNYVKDLEEINNEMLEALKNWNKSFGDSLRFQDYHVNVFNALNKRYIESKTIIEKATGLKIEEVIK